MDVDFNKRSPENISLSLFKVKPYRGSTSTFGPIIPYTVGPIIPYTVCPIIPYTVGPIIP